MTLKLQPMLDRIDDRVEDIVELTRDLVRFPTVNPPGDVYRPCAEFIGDRLRKRGFDVEYVRAEGAPGDSDAYPRINVIARHEGSIPGPCVHFNGHIDVVNRALLIFDHVLIAISNNSEKSPVFSVDERMDLITLGLGGLLILVIGISLGWWLGRDKPSSVLQSRDAKLQTQLLIAQESVRAFSLEMVGTMRELVGGETIQRPLRQSLAELDAGLAALKKEEGEAGQRFQEARRLINNLATEHQRGQLALTRMEQTIRRAADKAHGVQISLAKQNAAIGMLYIELASEMEEQGNLKRAQELLMTAARVDPNNASLYMDKRRRLGGEEKESTP